jgi:hypothetical protein
MKLNNLIKTSGLMAAMYVGITSATFAQAQDLPDPDGKPADMTKPVKVFIIMGQSNTLEMGKVTDELKTLYPFLADDAGAWSTRQDVRNVSVMVGKGVYRNEWLTVNPNKIGIEIGIGHQLGNALEEPVMILKSSIGNRSLGWDLLPPGSPRTTHNGVEIPGYKETVKSKTDKTIVPFVAGGDMIQWYAGKQYDDDVANAKKVLSELATHYPEATKFEVAGFLWWQGEKDAGDAGHATNYEKNLVYLIKQLRKDFESPNAKFVMATIGEVTKESTGNSKLILDGMLAADGESGKYQDFKGNVSTVYSHPYANGGSGNGHYSGNAKTYMDVGLKMGEAMVKLIKK